MDKRSIAVVCAVSVSVIWGLSFLSTKVALAALPPMTIAVGRFVVAVVLVLPIALFAKENLRIALRDVPLMAASGLLGVTLYFLCENNGIAISVPTEKSQATPDIADRAVRASTSRANFEKYHHARAVTAFKEFSGRTHLIIAEPGWEEVADYAIDWAEKTLHEKSK